MIKTFEEFVNENFYNEHEDDDNRIYNYHPKTNDELIKLVNSLIEERGVEADLNDIDTSGITEMQAVFQKTKFNGDISKWDVSNVKNMTYMFERSYFNGDISQWDVSNVKDMSHMFEESEFDGDISSWNVSNVENMSSMFANSEFTEKDISQWNVDPDIVKMMMGEEQ